MTVAPKLANGLQKHIPNLDRDRLTLALEAGGMGVREWHPGSDRSIWDTQMYRLLGLPQEGTVPGAQAFMSLVHPEDLPVLTAKVEKALESHGDFAHDFRILRADTGEERWLAGRGRVLANAAGELLAMVGVNYDITEATRNQAKLKVASERRAEFLAVLGHELRNPLAPLSYLARQMEMAAGQDKTQAKNAQVIKRQVDLLTRLVDDLLEVARIELGKIDLHWETVPADELIAGAVEVVMPAITDRQQQLSLDLAPGILIRGDRMRLMQVITNLLKNAAKYTPQSGRIQVQVKQTDQSVQIRISDTGPGIDPSLLPTLFDPFTQGLKTLDRTDGGLGVGLSVVKRLVELHGGQVSVASSPKGTTFTISLSAESLNPAITLNGDPAGPVNETVTESLRGLHLLLAEDQRDAADILAQLLRAEGLQVDIAYDGQQCLDMAQRNRPDAILMDIGMPKLDGWTVARNLRSNPRFSAVVMVAMSGYGQPRDCERSKEAGFDLHLTKPADVTGLLNFLALARAPAGRMRQPGMQAGVRS
ncbi:MAG: hypothetical protein RL676_831 [Pseudomonadota bacterium]